MAASRITYRPDPQFLAQAGRSPEMRRMLQELADSVAERARSIGPKDDDAPHYVDQIEGDVDLVRPRGGGPPVFAGRVNAYKFTSHWIEFGSVNNPPFAPLRRATEAVGLRLTER